MGVPIRATVDEITDKRSRRKPGFLVTGGTGFLGSHLAVKLLQSGYPVYLLTRSRGTLSAGQRVEQLFDWFGVRSDRLKLHVIEGRLDEPRLGLDPAAYDGLIEAVEEIVHCASDTSFSERKRPRVEQANVRNFENLLCFASKSRCYFIHHISTAYVAGKNGSRCPEAIVETHEFSNVYEETKHRAEKIAKRTCAENGIRLGIYRPSIVYGHSRTGKTFRFNALYYPVKTLLFLRNLYVRDIRESGGGKAEAMGVKMDDQGYIHLPIRIESAEGGLNLIPIDYFTEAFASIMEEALEGGVFHLVNPKSKSIRDLAEYIGRFFGIRGISAVPREALQEMPRNGLETLFEQYIDLYGPYIKEERTFEHGKSAEILGRRNIECPEFDYTVFERCMQYAVDTHWGSKLFGN